uniref:Putative secreted protein n=1 Tax=Anopheles darlingi TaxID=43151 RepID=A0A2M4DRA7_ANODA
MLFAWPFARIVMIFLATVTAGYNQTNTIDAEQRVDRSNPGPTACRQGSSTLGPVLRPWSRQGPGQTLP